MYLAMVKVFNTYASRAMLKYSLAGWVMPLIFPTVGIAWGGKHFVNPKTLVKVNWRDIRVIGGNSSLKNLL
jgi:hypothetical protein